MAMPTETEVKSLPETRSYIKWVRQEVLSWEVENIVKKVDKIGIRNISIFFEIVGLEEKYCRAEIKKAQNIGENFCVVSGWRINWASEADVRAKFKKAGVAMTPPMGKITGKVKKDKNDFDPGDYELQKCIGRFMA